MGGDAGASKCDLTASRCVGSLTDGGTVGAGGAAGAGATGGAGAGGASGMGVGGVAAVGFMSDAGKPAPQAAPPNEESCDCRMPGSRTTPSGLAAALLLAAGLMMRRRRPLSGSSRPS
jgi:MYXO-CTERM domain-containing protein